MAENIPRGTPARILILLALLLAGTAAGLWHDASRRDTLESVHWPTAAGLPAGTVPGDGLVSFAEKTWTLGPEEPRADEAMFHVRGTAPEEGSVFSPVEGKLPADAPLFFRVAPGTYRRLVPH